MERLDIAGLIGDYLYTVVYRQEIISILAEFPQSPAPPAGYNANIKRAKEPNMSWGGPKSRRPNDNDRLHLSRLPDRDQGYVDHD